MATLVIRIINLAKTYLNSSIAFVASRSACFLATSTKNIAGKAPGKAPGQAHAKPLGMPLGDSTILAIVPHGSCPTNEIPREIPNEIPNEIPRVLARYNMYFDKVTFLALVKEQNKQANKPLQKPLFLCAAKAACKAQLIYKALIAYVLEASVAAGLKASVKAGRYLEPLAKRCSALTQNKAKLLKLAKLVNVTKHLQQIAIYSPLLRKPCYIVYLDKASFAALQQNTIGLESASKNNARTATTSGLHAVHLTKPALAALASHCTIAPASSSISTKDRTTLHTEYTPHAAYTDEGGIVVLARHYDKNFSARQHKDCNTACSTQTTNRLRRVYLDDNELAHLTQQLARKHAAAATNTSATNAAAVKTNQIWPRLKRRYLVSAKNLLHVFYVFNATALKGENIPPSAHWLIDNYYILDKIYQQIKRDLNPKLAPKIEEALELCLVFLEHRDCVLGLQSFEEFILAYQKLRPLTIAAIGALPLCLRMVLLQKATLIALNLQHAKEMQILSEQVFQELCTADCDIEKQYSLLANLEDKLKCPSFVTNFYYQLREQKQYSLAADWLKENISNCQTIASEFEAEQANNCTSMANIVHSIQALDHFNGDKWFAKLNLVDRLLTQQCEYDSLDEASRGHCRQAIEEIAQHSSFSELEIAQHILTAMQENSQALHYYISIAGRLEIEKRCQYKLPLGQRMRRLLLKYNMSFMLGSIFFICLAISVVLYRALAFYSQPVLAGLFTFLFLPFAIEVGSSFFNKIVGIALPPRTILGYNFAKAIPDEYCTLVAIPSLLINKATIDELVRSLKVNYLHSAKGALYYALVTDWVDSKSQHTSSDQILLDYAQNSINKLNTQLGFTSPRFFLLHRQRKFNHSENCFIGWERKRGKLHELSKLLRGKGEQTSFISSSSAATALPKNIKYIICLDSDSKLLPDSAAKLIGKLAYGAKDRFSILQPRILNLIAPAQFTSLFQKIFASCPGINPYSAGASDSYQDLFNQGIYIGKGIYDIDSFERALQGKIKENTVLSHDLLEGGYSRCAFVSDVSLGEEYPASYRSDTSRQERWARGDWQLLPYIWQKLTATEKALPALTLWQMIDNLRRWSLAPLLVLGYFLGACLLPGYASAIWQLSSLAAMFSAPIIALFSAFVHFERNIYISSHLRSLMQHTINITLDLLMRLCFMAHSACYLTRSCLLSLYRIAISRKHMLQWKSTGLASLESQDLASFFNSMVSSLLVGFVALALHFGHVVKLGNWFLFCASLWLIAPLVAYKISQPNKGPSINDAQKEQFKAIGERIWRFYEAFCTAENNHLPIDNYQEAHGEKPAAYTSPTNIGMYLLTIVAAQELGWISLGQAIEHIENCFNSISKLTHFKGHLYNWYNVKTLQPLAPYTVSSVDSGNLAGHLLALSGALTHWSQQSQQIQQSQRERIAKLADKAYDLAMAMDFSFLICKKKQLLSIGYDVATQKLMKGCYDMLASEARLAYYVAIAKGDMHYKIWRRLGRFLTPVAGKACLLSWSGSMFEYLMPPLVMREEAASLLGQTNLLVVKKQISYGDLHNRPWGISEAAFNAFDEQLNYQYSNFGLAELGLQRALAKNYVVAPYATLLAAQIEPQLAIQNLNHLKQLGAYGKYGFYDSIDFTAHRLPKNAALNAHAVVKNYYAHHHGMSLVAIYNLLHNNRMQDYFHSHAQIQAYESLLQEQAPRCVAFSNFKALSQSPNLRDLFMEASERLIENPQDSDELLVLSSGEQSIILNAAGRNISHNSALTLQLQIIFSNHTSGQQFNLHNHAYKTIFSANSAQLYAEKDDIEVKLNIIALATGKHSCGACGIGQELTIVNKGPITQELEIDARLLAQSAASLATAQNVAQNVAIELDASYYFATAAGVAQWQIQATGGATGGSTGGAAGFTHALTLKPNAKQRFILWHIMRDTVSEPIAIRNYLSQDGIFDIERQKSWALEQAKLFQMGIAAKSAASYQRLASAMLRHAKNLNGHNGLHLLIKINNKNYTIILRDMLKAGAYLRSHGLNLGLTVVNEAQGEDFDLLDKEITWLHQAYSVPHSAFDYIATQQTRLELEAKSAQYFTLFAERGFLVKQFAT